MLYFDNAATTFPKPDSVRKAVSEALFRFGANPGRSGYKMGMETARKVFECREKAAEFFGISESDNGHCRVVCSVRSLTEIDTAVTFNLSSVDTCTAFCYGNTHFYRDCVFRSFLYRRNYTGVKGVVYVIFIRTAPTGGTGDARTGMSMCA